MEDIYGVLERLETELLPAALELASRVVFYNSLGSIIIGILAAIVVALCAPRMVNHIKLSIEITKERGARYGRDEEVDNSLWAIAYGVGVVVGSLPTAFNLFDIWNWVGVFDPKLALAKIIFDRIMQQ